MYVAVKGGERAIDNAHQLLANRRRGDTAVAELGVQQVRQQLPLAVARVMSEGSLYDEELAALAIKQAAGDLMEAIFLLRAYRTTLPRFGASEPLDTTQMQLERRISATFKDLPGGQLLGPTFDYTHRGDVEVWMTPAELGFAVPLGDIEITECEMVNQFVGESAEQAQFTRGYGLAFGYAERKTMGMALVDRALRAGEYGEEVQGPAQEEEFVLMHCDNVEAAGFVSHLKLPHYVDFQAELELIRKLRRQAPAEENR
ncbi:MAG: carbon-phosphorus lyase complex subunit PhnI [Gammaproteobacteria bacterium HGW-Gammaproteobacteria-12]|nr:MAG: carbon-phosphorus lyase complex subunit PhnI [Gammaproteobacteria bacterium HGW-Gammaproteobacteria-12]